MKHFFTLFFVVWASVVLGQLMPVKEILSPTVRDDGSTRAPSVSFKGKLYFPALNADVYGTELYMTDGTPNGTKLFIDLVPGPASSDVSNLVATGDRMFFTTGPIGITKSLWVSDGTIAGTKKLPNTVNGNFSKLLAHNGSIYFEEEGNGGLWRTNGVDPAVKISTGPVQLENGMFCAAKDYFYFTSTSSVGTQLWVTDGTAGSAHLLVEGTAASGINIVYYGLTAIENTLYFVDASEYRWWKVEGTSDPEPIEGDDYNNVSGKVISWNNQVYYNRRLGPTDLGFFRFDRETAPVFLADINASLWVTVEYNEKLFFQTTGGLWSTDGTAAGTNQIFPSSGTIHNISGMGIAGNKLILVAKRDVPDGLKTEDLWAYDETNGLVNSTSLRWVIANPNNPVISSINNKVFMNIDDETVGAEPFTLDETHMPVLLKNINRSMIDHYPENLWRVDNNVLFTIDDGVNGRQVWKTDGTEEGTTIIKDEEGELKSVNKFSLVSELKDLLFFTAYNGSTSNVWRTDGTAAGTFKIESAANSTVPRPPNETSPVLNGFIYYQQFNGDLWKTDGSENGAMLVRRISNTFDNFVSAVVNNQFFFMDYLNNLWKSDGTAEGTSVVFNFETEFPPHGKFAGDWGAYPFGDKFFLLGGNYSVDDLTLWISDGTQNGTLLLKKFKRSISPGDPVLGVLNNKIYFWDAAGANGQELWQSDGTLAGTQLVRILDPAGFLYKPGPTRIYSDNNFIYFSAYADGTPAIWKTDGTHDGTTIIKTQVSAAASGKKVGGVIYFAGTSDDKGQELWRTDGTGEGTHAVDDIIAGPSSSVMPEMEATADRVIVVGRDADHWFGIWATDELPVLPKQDQQIDFPDIQDKQIDDAPFTLTATASSGLTVTFEIVSGPATISGNTLTITGAGEVKVKASQAGNESYNAASSQQTFLVELVLGLEDKQIVSVWPNPATSNVVVHASPSEFQEISLKDVLGKEISSKPVASEDTVFDTGHLPRGIYILQFKSKNKFMTHKIVLK